MDGRTRRRQGSAAVLAVLLFGMLVGCGGGPETEDTTAVVRIDLTPESASLEPGDQVQLVVKAFNGRGKEVPGVKPTFESNATDLATVDASGLVLANRPGAAVITAKVSGKTASMAVTVLDDIGSIQIDPSAVALLTGETLQLQAVAFDIHGSRMDGRTFEWSVDNERVATVNATGLLTALGREDETKVRATSGGIEGVATLNVRKGVARIDILPENPSVREKGTLQLTAIVRDDRGGVLTQWPVAWTSGDQTTATVDSKGLVHGIKPGLVNLFASAGSVSESVEVEVKPDRVTRIEISPGDATVEVGSQLQFQARTFNIDGVELFGRAIHWATEDPENGNHAKAALAGPIDDTGLLKARFPFRAEVRAMVIGDSASASVPLEIVLRFRGLGAGRFHTCALTAGKEAWCWGENGKGETGRSPESDNERLPQPVQTDLKFSVIAAGNQHTCALTDAGKAYCWGWNEYGQLGTGDRDDRHAPAPVARPTGAAPFETIYAGDSYSCGVDTDGQAFCWGRNHDGRLGDGTREDRTVPAPVIGETIDETLVPVRFRSLSLGFNPSGTEAVLSCGVSTSGVGYCWGMNENQQHGIGAGASLFSNQPLRLEGEHVFRSIGVGETHACGLTDAGSPLCWGNGTSGQLGDGFSGLGHFSVIPIPAETQSEYTLLTAGGSESCAMTAEGEVDCWGFLAAGAPTNPVPSRLGQDEEWIFLVLSKGQSHTCGITAEHVVYCWGSNFRGQLAMDLGEQVVLKPTRIFPENPPDVQ